MKLQNILVPVDFSKCSNNALEHAIGLAQMAKAKLTLLHCYTVHVPAAEVTLDLHPTLAKQYQRNAERNFRELRESTTNLNLVAHEELIKVSFIKDGIAQTVKEISPDLIIMGTKGADNRLDAFFGSNTYNTIKHSKTPILAIPKEAKFKPVQNILFAVDFKHVEDMHGLDIIKTMMTLFKAKVQILHVGRGWSDLSMNQTKEAAAMVEYFNQTDHTFHFIREETSVEDAIDHHLAKNQNELLILIARKHQFPGSLFKKKVTRNTVMHTELPLLTLPDLR